MVGKAVLTRSLYLVRILTCGLFLATAPFSLAGHFAFLPMAFEFQKDQSSPEQATLVRVHFVTKYWGAKDTVEINGKLLTDSSPVIIQSFSSTGIVLDQKGDIMTFLGYRWLDIQGHESSIEVLADGRRWKGKLVGIDQRNKVAVIKLMEGKLRKTPTCVECELRDGVTVMAPVSDELSRLRRAQVVSIGSAPARPDQGGWIITVDQPFPDVGQPILTADHRVLGFIANQDPMGITNTIYPISLLLASAEKIIKTGGDIPAGWLGLYVVDSNPAIGPGVLVQRVETNSPAKAAGLKPGDFLLKFNGERIQNISHYIQLVEGSPVGSKAVLEVARKGSPLTLSALIGSRRHPPEPGKFSFNLPASLGFPVAGFTPDPAPRNQRLLIGVDTVLLDAQIADSLQIPAQNGLLVLNIQRDSAAEQAGVLIGDVILSIDGQQITDGLDFASFLETHNWGDEAILQVNRKGIIYTIQLQLAK